MRLLRTSGAEWTVSVMIAGVLTVVVLPIMEGPYQPVRMPVLVGIALAASPFVGVRIHREWRRRTFGTAGGWASLYGAYFAVLVLLNQS